MEIKKTSMTATPTYMADGYFETTYEPKWSMTTLDWFNVAKCARARMSLSGCANIHQWKGERRSFYTSLQMMQVDEVQFMDDDTCA